MAPVAFGATLLPDGRLTARACGAGIEHRTSGCARDIGPFAYTRGVHLVLEDDTTHHAVLEAADALGSYADRVDAQSAKRARVDEERARARVKRIDGRPVLAPESDESFYARVRADVCGLAEERDKANGHVKRETEAPREAVAVNLNAVDAKGQVIR